MVLPVGSIMRSRSKPLLHGDQVAKSRPKKPRNPAQPHLPFDKMPQRVEPALALLKPKAPTGPDWAFEMKFDGYRLAIHIEPKCIRILTRGGHDWAARFPAIAEAAEKLGVGSAILDGEAVVVDEDGRSDFGALQRSLGGRGGKRISKEAVFYAFDLPYFDGHLLTNTDLSVRRHLLADLLDGANGAIHLSEELDGDGAELLEAACSMGLEGIIAIKCVQSESFVVIGYEHSAVARGGIGSLLLAARWGDSWASVGSVGTGFKEKDALYLRTTLDKLTTNKPAIPMKGKNLVFAQPTLIAEIHFRGWTDDGNLRHASFKGLREVQDNSEIFEMPS
jgi:bifunctional non-homologous end joining protein LigD